MIIKLDIEKLIQAFPKHIKESLEKNKEKTKLIEIVMDLGRRPEGRFLNGSKDLGEDLVSWQDLDYTTKKLGKFSNKNRVGIEQTLHRISCIKNRDGMVIGLTCRIGRAVLGSVAIIRDLLDCNQSLLILGKPGLGKTTLIREMGRILADEGQRRVIIVDSSNEIAGNSDLTHVGTGRARRMQIPPFENQQSMMIEAIENHMPEIIIVDEIGTELEAQAAQTIAERGVQLVGTAHGNCLENVIKNPTLCDLIGGIQYVTLSDEEARKRKTQKTIIERKTVPTFSLAIELNSKNSWTIHEKVESSVDLILKNQPLQSQVRCQKNKRFVQIQHCHKKSKRLFQFFDFSESYFNSQRKQQNLLGTEKKKDVFLQKTLYKKPKKKNQEKKLFIYAPFFSNQEKNQITNLSKKSFFGTQNLRQADILLVSKLYLKETFSLQEFAKEKKIPVYFLKTGSIDELKRILRSIKKNNIAFT